jgi:aryl-alcohol dehydrogenase-like predicted oxidoreductase
MQKRKLGNLEVAAPYSLDSRPEHIRQVVDATLERLTVETIDLLYRRVGA